MTVKERIRLFIDSKGLSVRAFEIKCGLSNGLINNITESISKGTLDKISKSFPELNKGWLLAGEGNMLKTESKSVIFNEEIPITNSEIEEMYKLTIESLKDQIRMLKERISEKDQKIEELKTEMQESGKKGMAI